MDHYSTPTPTVRTREAATNSVRLYHQPRGVLFVVVVRKSKMKEKKEILKIKMSLKKYASLHRILTSVVDECVVEFDENGLSVVTVNMANTSMVKVLMPKRAFMEYEIESPVSIGIDLREMEERGLLNADTDETVDLVLFEHTGDKHHITHDCKLSHDIFCETLWLLDPDTMKMPKWKEIKTNLNFQLQTSVLRKVSSRDEFVCIECGNSHITFSDEFDNVRWATIPIPLLSGNRAKVRYGARLLHDITETITSEHISIRLSDDYPCVIKTKFGGGCVAEWLVAPRIRKD